jgi:Calpain family cysteine protease
MDILPIRALAVIAERQDLIARIFGADLGAANNNPYGIVQVNLFLDGFWKSVTMDNFLPCIINETGEEDELQAALKASMGGGGTRTATNAFAGTGYTLSGSSSSDGSTNQQHEKKKNDNGNDGHGSSKYDPFCMSDKNRQVLANTENFLQQHQQKPINPYAKKLPLPHADTAAAVASGNASLATVPSKRDRIVTTQDLAYSKAKNQQLWVRVKCCFRLSICLLCK